MGETSAGSIQVELELTSDLDKGMQSEASELANKIRKQIESMSGDMFKGLRENLVASLDKMAEAIKACLDRTKMEMRAFVEEMSGLVKQISGVQMPYERSANENQPNNQSKTSNQTRGPPSMSIRRPKIKFDPQFDTDMFHQKYQELESMMDMYDNQILAKQNQRKELLNSYKPNMGSQFEMNLDKQIMALDIQIAKLQDASSRANISLSAMDRQMASTSISSKGVTSRIRELISNMGGLKGKIASFTLDGLQKGLRAITGGAKTAGNALLELSKKLAPTSINKFSNGLKSGGRHAVSFAKNLIGIGTASKTASSGIGRAHMGVGRLVKSFMIFSLIFPLVSRGVMALASNLGQTLMTNSAFANSLNQVRSNLATAFTPIIQAIMPALNALMSGLAQVTAYISAFISGIFGKSYSATKQATSGIYAAKDAMGAYGSTAEKASKATEKMRKTLMGFDEINKLDDKDNDNNSGGGGAPVYTPTDVNEGIVNKWVKKLKDLWKKGDYAGIGKLIGEQVNKGVMSFTKWVSWNRIGGSITKFCEGFTEIFNSLIFTIDWERVGNAFGSGVNTIANTLYLLLTGINWQNIGSALAKGLNGIIKSVDWNKLGSTIGAYFQAKINALYGFVTTADWQGIGKALADGVMGLINTVDFPKFTASLGIGISGAISSIHTFINNIDWRELGNTIAKSINNFFSNINWADFGMTLSDAAKGILDALLIGLRNIDWSKVGYSVATFIKNVDWVGVAGTLLQSIIEAVHGIGSGVIKLAVELGKWLWEGFCKGVEDFFSDPIGFLKRVIVDPIVNGIKSLFGIHSPSTVMAEIGKFLIQGLIKGIESIPIIGPIAGVVGDGMSWIKDRYSDFKEGGKKLFDNLKEGIQNNPIVKSVSNVVNDGMDWISGKYEDFKKSGRNLFEKVKDGITNNPITKSVSGVINNGIKAITDKYTDFKSKGKAMIDNLKKGVDSNDHTVLNRISKVATDMANRLTGGTVNLAPSWGSDMMSGLASGIRGATGWVTSAVSNVANTIASWLHFTRPDIGPLRQYETWMPDMMDGLSNTLELSTPVFINKVKSLAGSMADVMQSALQEPTIAFAGERSLSVQHEWKEINEKDEKATMEDIINVINGLKQEIKEVKQVIEEKDTDVYLDGESIKDNTVKRVNKDTRKNGKCPIDL